MSARGGGSSWRQVQASVTGTPPPGPPNSKVNDSSPNVSSSDTDTSIISDSLSIVEDAIFDHALAMRKSAPRGGTWKFGANNLSVEIPLGPVTLFNQRSISIHDTKCVAWTFRVEPVKLKYEQGIRRERYCFGLVPERCIGNPGFLLIEEWKKADGNKDVNMCRMEGGYPLPGKLHTVMISPMEKEIHFFMDNLPEKVVSHRIPDDMFPCRLGILAFMHQTVEIVNDLHPKEFYQKLSAIETQRKHAVPRNKSGGAVLSQYLPFLACEVPCFKSQSVDTLSKLFPPKQSIGDVTMKLSMDEPLQFSSREPLLCVVYSGSVKEVWQPAGAGPCERILERGHFFQEELMLDGLPDCGCKYFGNAKDTEILVFPKKLVLDVFKSDPCFLDTLCEQYNSQNLDLTGDIESLCDEQKEDGWRVDVSKLLTRHLKTSHSLTVLTMTKCNIRSLNFSLLPETLKKLCLGFNQLKDLENECGLKTWMRRSPKLTELFLHCNNLDSFPEEVLIHLTCLQGLGLDSNRIKKFDLAHLPRSLKKLWLSNNIITELAFEELHTKCPHLELFDISFNRVAEIDASKWPENLANFYASGNGVNEVDFTRFPSQVKILDISGVEQGGKGIEGSIEDVDLTAMREFKDLEILDISHNQIAQLELRNIPNSCLALFAAGNALGTFLTVSLKHCDNIQILDLSHNKIVKFESRALPRALRILNLYNNSLQKFDTADLPELKTLWLGKNRLECFDTTGLPSTLKILSLTSNAISSLKFDLLPRGLDVLNVNGNQLTELPLDALPDRLQQLEMKKNKIKEFDWQHVGLLKCLMSISFDDNAFLDNVTETKVLDMFRCILTSPNLSLKPSQIVLYLKNFEPLPYSVVGNDEWLRAGLPVPSDETISKNEWRLICRYMIAVGRSGGAEPRSEFSVVYVPHLPNLKGFEPKHALSSASSLFSTPKRFDNEDQRMDVSKYENQRIEILKLSPHELCSRSIMSHQRICVLTLDITDEVDPILDLKPIFSCLQNLYQSLARVSIIVVLCNQTHPGQPFDVENEVRDEISEQIKKEIDRLNDQVQREATFQSETVGINSKPTFLVQSVDAAPPGRSILEIAIEKVKRKIAELRSHVQNEEKLKSALELEGKSGKIPAFGDDVIAAELFWEEACCKSKLSADCREQCEKLWSLNRKLGRLISRSESFARSVCTLTPSSSREPPSRSSFSNAAFDTTARKRSESVTESRAQHHNTDFTMLQLVGVVRFSDVEVIKVLLSNEVNRRNEVVPNYFNTVREAIIQLNEQWSKPDCTSCVMSRNDIVTHLKRLDTRKSSFSRHRVDGFKMNDIPDPDIWQSVLHCASLGIGFVLNNSFFPDAQFVRQHLADVFSNKNCFSKDTSSEFIKAFKDHFLLPSEATKDTQSKVKNLARNMWIANKASLCVFTKQCAVYLKHWQKMFGTSPSSSSSVIWKDCVQFFEDCGIIVPFFHYEEGELQWYITRSCTELPPKIDAEAMHAFYVLSMTPTCFLTRCWSSLHSRVGKADGISMTLVANGIHISRHNSVCNIILLDFPDRNGNQLSEEGAMESCNVPMGCNFAFEMLQARLCSASLCHRVF